MSNELKRNLLIKLKCDLPQRVKNIDTGEKADEYRLSISAAEKAYLIKILEE